MIHIPWNPTDRQLKQFAWACLPGFALVGWVARRLADGWTLPILGAALGLACLLLGLARPKSLRPLFVVLSAITAPIGWILSNLLAAIFYFLVLTPLGLVFRLFGRDPLALRARGASSYWKKHTTSPDPRSYYRQG